MKAILLGLAVALVAGASLAQPSDYPNRPVKVIAPFAPGGPVDIVARVLAPKLSERLGQQFYVENHPGGSGNIGTALAAKAPADGYTILVISSTLVVNPSLFAKLGFDTASDLAPVSLVGVSPQVLLVNPSVPATNVKELVAWVKTSPGKHSYAHAGLGTPGYLAGETEFRQRGADIVVVVATVQVDLDLLGQQSDLLLRCLQRGYEQWRVVPVGAGCGSPEGACRRARGSSAANWSHRGSSRHDGQDGHELSGEWEAGDV